MILEAFTVGRDCGHFLMVNFLIIFNGMNIRRRWLHVLAAAVMTLCICACSDDDGIDSSAAKPEIPILTNVGSYTFNGLDETMATGTYEGGREPEFVWDEDFASNVLHLDGGYVSTANPLADRPLVEGFSFTAWVKFPGAHEDAQTDAHSRAADGSGALVSFADDAQGRKLVVTERMGLAFDGQTLSEGLSGLNDGEWHYFAVKMADGVYTLYKDGAEAGTTEIDGALCGQMFEFLSASATAMYIGYGAENRPEEFWMENLNVYKDEIGEDETEVPERGIVTIGKTDYTSAMWEELSDVETIDGDGEFEYKFTNHSDGAAYPHNYVFVVSNGKRPGDEGYAEYAVMRADWYGWTNGQEGPGHTISFEYDFNIGDFNLFMQDAEVDLRFVRRGTGGTMTAHYTTAQGKTYYYTCTLTNLPADGTIGTFFTVERSYIELRTSATYAGAIRGEEAEEDAIVTVGKTDYTSAAWEELSDVETIDGDGEFEYRFTNRSGGAEFPHNYWFVVSNGKRPGDEGYAEYAVMRADWYGWTDAQEGEGHTISFDFDFNIDDFKTFMRNVEVDLKFVRQGNVGVMTAYYTTAEGETYYYTCTVTNLPADGTIGTFFTVEKAYIELDTSKTYVGPVR